MWADTGRWTQMYSKELDENVSIIEYEGSGGFMECSKCGKKIKHKMFVIQDADTDLEIMYLGSNCIKNFK